MRCRPTSRLWRNEAASFQGGKHPALQQDAAVTRPPGARCQTCRMPSPSLSRSHASQSCMHARTSRQDGRRPRSNVGGQQQRLPSSAQRGAQAATRARPSKSTETQLTAHAKRPRCEHNNAARWHTGRQPRPWLCPAEGARGAAGAAAGERIIGIIWQQQVGAPYEAREAHISKS